MEVVGKGGEGARAAATDTRDVAICQTPDYLRDSAFLLWNTTKVWIAAAHEEQHCSLESPAMAVVSMPTDTGGQFTHSGSSSAKYFPKGELCLIHVAS
jgi:hypothetical protein